MAENTEIVEEQKQKLKFSESLTNNLMEIKDALPKDLNITRFVQNGVALLNGNEVLAEFAKEYGTKQIKQGMIRSAFVGLDFMNGEAYLVPYGSNLNFRPSYKGDIKLAKKYSIRKVTDIYAKIVRDGDEYEEGIENGKPYVNFKPKPFNKADVIGVFAVCLFSDGGMVYDSMNIDELNAAKRKSKTQNAMAWKEFPWEMQKKTVIHRLCKTLELEFESPQQKEIFDESVAIETDVMKQAENEVAENQGSMDFDEDVIDSEIVEN